MIGRSQHCGLLVLILLFVGFEKGRAEVTKGSRAASVLLGEFETVFQAKSDLLSDSGTYNPLASEDGQIVRLPFAELLEGLKALGAHISTELLSSSDAVLLGAKEFRPPKGLGGVRSQRCYITLLKANSQFDLRKYFHQAPIGSTAGAQIWSWSAKLGEFGEEDPSPSFFYASQIGDSYVLVSNNLEELQTTAKKLTLSDNPNGMLDRVRDWELVSQHQIWGYRRYRHSGVVDREAAGMSFVTKDAEAVIFFLEFEKKVAVMRLLCSDATEDTAVKISAGTKLPPLKLQAAGVWEARFPLTGDEESSDRLSRIMDLFGFGAYV